MLSDFCEEAQPFQLCFAPVRVFPLQAGRRPGPRPPLWGDTDAQLMNPGCFFGGLAVDAHGSRAAKVSITPNLFLRLCWCSIPHQAPFKK